jgi:hypothetical protein
LKGSAINGYTYQDVRATALLSYMPSIKRACHTACDARGSTAALAFERYSKAELVEESESEITKVRNEKTALKTKT